MLPVKSLFVTQTIPYKKVAQVATGAQQHVLHDTRERPVQLSRCELFVDKVFCRGAKQTTLSQIREMSLCTTLLHLEMEKPEGVRSQVLIRAYSGRICEIQVALKKLMAGDTLEFGSAPGRALVGNDSFLVHRSETVVRTGISLTGRKPVNVRVQSERVPAPAVIAPAIGPGAAATPAPTILLVNNRLRLTRSAYRQIKVVGKVAFRGTVFPVRFLNHEEPAALGLGSDYISQSVRNTLYWSWIRSQARCELLRLDSIRLDRALPVPITFPDTESELFGIRAQLTLDGTWNTAVKEEQRTFPNIVQEIEKGNQAESSSLREIFKKLSHISDVSPQHRKKYLCAETRLHRLENRHRQTNERLTTLKQIYWQFFELAKVCTSKRMQDIPLGRIKNIGDKLSNLNGSVAPTVCAETLAVQLQNAPLFIENFSSSLSWSFQKITDINT